MKKIEFKQNEDDPNDQDYANQMDLSFFSCEIDATSGKTKGMFFDKLVMEKGINQLARLTPLSNSFRYYIRKVNVQV